MDRKRTSCICPKKNLKYHVTGYTMLLENWLLGVFKCSKLRACLQQSKINIHKSLMLLLV